MMSRRPTAVKVALWTFMCFLISGFLALAQGYMQRDMPTGGGPLLSRASVSAPTIHPPLGIHVIDVGQGSAMLIQHGSLGVLIDGGNPWMGERVVQYCREAGVGDLICCIASCSATEHVGGLFSVLQHLRVSCFMDTGFPAPRDDPMNTAARLGAVVRRLGLPHLQARRGMVVDIASTARLNVLWPPQDQESGNGPDVDRIGERTPAVCLLEAGAFRFLFPSDLDAGAVKSAMRSGLDVRADVLVLPAHGDRRACSATFIEQVRPLLAVASVGVYNESGLPHPEVVQRLQVRGTRLFRTDRDGSVTLWTDGRSLWMECERTQRR